MSNWIFSFSVLLFSWWICTLQDASADVRVIKLDNIHAQRPTSTRIIRSSKNYSRFVHHELEEEVSTTPESSDDAILCMGDDSSTNQLLTRRRRTDEVIKADEKETNSSTVDEEYEYSNVHNFEEENSTMSTTTVLLEDAFSDEFINCEIGHSMVEKDCFELMPNMSIYVPVYKRLFNTTDYFPTEDGLGVYVCPTFWDDFEHKGKDEKFPRILAIVSLVGTAISTFCIVLHIAMFLTFKKLRNLPGYCLISLCVSLLVAYICLFIPYPRKEPSDCTAVGIIKAYALLGSFFWMNVMSYDIWRSLRLATAKLRLTSDKPILTRFAMYSAYSWGCPLLIVIFGFIVNSSNSSMEYRMLIAQDTCWFQYKQALMLYFAAPLFTLLILNVLLFMSSFYMISGATMNSAENKADLWSRFMVSIRLAVVMGLMWIFGVLATATEAVWLWYFNVIFNVLQGVFIFFSFTLTKKTRQECSKAIARKKSSVFPTLTSSQPSSSV